MFGLRLNLGNTEIFYRGLSKDFVLEFVQLSSFEIGMLLVLYLGVPLISGCLMDRDCKPLIVKITSCLETWAIKKLLYAVGCNSSNQSSILLFISGVQHLYCPKRSFEL